MKSINDHFTIDFILFLIELDSKIGVKVQRRWKNPTSAIAEGQRVYYNIVKPHQTLEEKTPSGSAGLTINRKNKFKEMIELSSHDK